MVAGMRFKARRISVGGSWGGAEARFGTWGRAWGGLGVGWGGLGRPFGGSVALLGANMAEKTDKSIKKSRFPDRHPTSEEEKWRPEAPKGSR